MPETAPEPAVPLDTVHLATVRWRVRDETGLPTGAWRSLNRLVSIEEAIAFQKGIIYLTPLTA